MGFIEQNGVKIYYETRGVGEPLILIEVLAQQISM